MAGDVALWTPVIYNASVVPSACCSFNIVCLFEPKIDVLNFWKVPVQLQNLVINSGSLVEAAALSYFHGKSADDDVIEEPKTRASKIVRVPLLSLDNDWKSAPLEEILVQAKREFAALDVDRKGYFFLLDGSEAYCT